MPRGADDEAALTEDIIALARQYGRYGYRRVTALLRDAGWHVNRKRVERIWRREGLKVPQKQPQRSRLWLNDGSRIRLWPEYPGYVWSCGFVEGRTHDGRKFRILSIIDEASRECLALPVARRLRSEDVLAALAELFVTRGPPAHIRSDNGPGAAGVRSTIYRQCRATVAGEDRREDALHHTWQPMGEWLLWVLQWLDARRALERGDLLHSGRGSDPDRSLATALQHRKAAQLPGLSASGSGNGHAAMAALRFRYAPPAASHGARGNLALTINTDHSVGAGQGFVGGPPQN